LRLTIIPDSNSTYNTNTLGGGVPADFNIIRRIFDDNEVLIAEDTDLGDFYTSGISTASGATLYNNDPFYNPASNNGLVDVNDYTSQVTVKYIVSTTDGLCGPIEIENTYTAGCKTSGGEVVNGTYQVYQNVDTTLQLQDKRKCSTDSI